ncbi:DUF2161 domain-containing phosphodiesterase [Sporosarcina beigongshangi]|uniref:DUF2161 domain-containing phosphodiesterase n=1 Tax=Sporosarcina beigongshangi TaxID=2782538 RepID=UPI00193A6D0F|nr:DUF2161 family putative PD-(D/E)XK-type phosphodiesterase [Sporosarcina beigongshangi]
MKKQEKKRYEVDLYQPVKDYFINEGYEVYGEVNHCDVAAVRESELVIIELKLSLTIDLLIQATKRQRLTNQVYIAIPKPTYSNRSRKWKDSCHLIRRLELGLITVEFLEDDVQIKIIHEPASFDRKKSMQRSQKKRKNMLSEIKGRTGDYNTGGSSQMKIVSAYKENSIHIACCLLANGPLSPKLLRGMGTGEKTLSILSKNYDGWFDKIRRGIYMLSKKGENELKAFPNLTAYYNGIVSEACREE